MKSCLPTIIFGLKKSNSGQALLIILLLLAIGLTVGLSVASRSITDIRISQQEEESARTFSAAEAGIEEAIKQNLGPGGTIPNQQVGNVTYNVTAVGQGGGSYFDFNGSTIAEGDIQTVWLVDNPGFNNPFCTTNCSFQFYWGNTTSDIECSLGGGTSPALEATLIYKSDTSYKLQKKAFDICENQRNNEFDPTVNTSCSAGGKGYYYCTNKITFNLGSNDTSIALRLRLLYNSNASHIMAVTEDDANKNLNSQGTCYFSTATYAGSNTTRKVQQCQGYKAPPGIFDYVLFSESGSIQH